MRKQNRKSFFPEKYSSKIRTEPPEQIFQIMDQALFFINNVIDVNIQMQEIIIEIRKKLVKNEFATLRELYKVYLNCNKLENFFNDKMYIFDIHNFDSITPELFIRFYGRLSQKIFCKFLYYSLNYKSLQFLTSNLLELLDINDQLNNYKNIDNFNIFIEIINFILEENKILLQILFELIVSENFVSSIDQFFMSVPEKEIVLMASPKKNSEQQIRRRRSGLHEQLTIKPTSYSYYKEKLESMIKNYQDKEERDSFLSLFSSTLKKQFSILLGIQNKDNLFELFEKQKLERHSKISIKLQSDHQVKKSKNKLDIVSNEEREKVKPHQKINHDQSEISVSEKTRKNSKRQSNDFFVPTASNPVIRKSKIIEIDQNFLIMKNRDNQKSIQLQKNTFLKKRNHWKHLKGQASSSVQIKPKSAIRSSTDTKKGKINKDLGEKYKNELKDVFDAIQNIKKMKTATNIKLSKENIQNPEESAQKKKSTFIYIPKSVSNYVLKYQINVQKHKSHFQPTYKLPKSYHNSINQLRVQNSFKPYQHQSCHTTKKLKTEDTEDKYWYQNQFKHKNQFTITSNYLKDQSKNNLQKNKRILKVKKSHHEIFSTQFQKLIYPL